jgi:hypothetical protein
MRALASILVRINLTRQLLPVALSGSANAAGIQSKLYSKLLKYNNSPFGPAFAPLAADIRVPFGVCDAS